MAIEIIDQSISREHLLEIAKEYYEDMIKGVVDIRQEIVALGGEMDSDSEVKLLQVGSIQSDLWGFNILLNKSKEELINEACDKIKKTGEEACDIIKEAGMEGCDRIKGLDFNEEQLDKINKAAREVYEAKKEFDLASKSYEKTVNKLLNIIQNETKAQSK